MKIRKARKEDYILIFKFLTENYCCGQYYNWDVGRLSFCRYAVNNEYNSNGFESWINKISVWEENDKIVALWNTEEEEDFFIQVSKEYKYLEEEIIKSIFEEIMSQFPKKNVVISVGIEDKHRIQLLERLGGIKMPFSEEIRILKINNINTQSISSSYHVEKIDALDELLCEKVSETYSYIWPESRYVPNGIVVQNLLKNAKGCKTLSWVVKKEDVIVAYTIGFLDGKGEYVHLYPIAVCPEYLNTEVLDTLLFAIKTELFERKIPYAVINAWYKPEEEQKFIEHGFIKMNEILYYEIPVC